MFANSESDIKTFFLLPAMPTPNGRMHLGHVGGPFLAIDVLSRHLKLQGNKVIVLSGTDSYDSYVTAQAEKEGKTPAEICNQYHSFIESDIRSMNMELDKFVNPLDPEWHPVYRKWLNLLLAQLQEAGVTHVVEEKVLFDEAKGKYLTGCWISGKCPVCYSGVRGYFCEDCGAHFRPEEIVEVQEVGSLKQVSNLFMELPEKSNIEGRGLHETIKNVYRLFENGQGRLLRLTANSHWGLSIGNDRAGDKFFNYPFAFAFALMLGEVAEQLAGSSKNALASNSGITCMMAFGIDNTIPVFGSILGIVAACPQYKQFDYYLVNHFLDLNGSKFSTSRRHAIWVDDIINKLGASSDIIRLYLANVDVQAGAGNVETSELVAFYNKTVDQIATLIVNGLTKAPMPGSSAAGNWVGEKFHKSLTEQNDLLNPGNYRLSKAASIVGKWFEFGSALDQSSEDYFWWLKGFALLAHPIMPQITEALWRSLGFVEKPMIFNFEATPALSIQRNIRTNQKKLSQRELDLLVG